MQKPKLSDKALKLKRNISPVREIMSFASDSYLQKLGVEPSSLISFAGGWVGHEAPDEYRRAYAEIIADNTKFHLSGAYSPTLGMPETKEAIINFESYLYNIKDIHQENIIVGHSSTQLANDLFQVLLDDGDKIVLTDPSYCNYPTQIYTGLKDIEVLRFSVLDRESFQYIADERIEEMRRFILSEKPKVVLLIVPDNPTSKVLSDRFVSAVLESVKEVGAYLVLDYAYKEIVFNNELPDYFSWGADVNLIQLRSNSKWGRGLGRRMGWMIAPVEVSEAMESVCNSSILCPDTLHQMAFSSFVNKVVKTNSLKKYLEKVQKMYEVAAITTINTINESIGLPCIVPDGGLYVCLKVGGNSAVFVDELLKSKGVLSVPGWGFGRSVQDAIRISYGPLVEKPDQIVSGIKKIADFIDKR